MGVKHKRKHKKKQQKGKGIEPMLLKARIKAIPKGIKMLYNIAKGKPTSARIQRERDKYKQRYETYRKSGGETNTLQWAKANHAVIKPDFCCIQ